MAEPRPSEPSPPPKPGKGWFSDLTQRSTGLPREGSPTTPANTNDTSPWKLAGIGLQFAGTVAMFLLIGRWLDNYFGWKFVATLTGLAIALIGSMYLLIKETMGRNR